MQHEIDRLLAENVAARAAVATSDARCRSVYDASPNGFALHRPVRADGRPDGAIVDFIVAYVNQAGANIVGLVAEDWNTGEAWISPETAIRFDRDGTGLQDTWFNLRFEPVRDAAGQVQGVLNFSVDVTDQVRARREVEGLLAESECARADAEVARGEAEAANRSKSEFLAIMSHELRTPLNAIDGYAELIEIGIRGPVTEEQRIDLARIRKNQRHLLGLIDGVLRYARVEAGAVEYKMTDVILDDVLATCEAVMAPQVRGKALSLNYDKSALATDLAPLRVWADQDKLQQIVLNLFSNAVKFTDPGGRITVRYLVDPESTGEAAGTVRVQVADTGRGIALKHLMRVFEPFVQVDMQLTRTEGGTGLGLAISREFARAMGGDLTVESEEGRGSTFSLSLPRMN